MSQVYFLYAQTVNLMKIGTSRDPEKRILSVRLISPVPVEVFAIMEGGRDLESQLHDKFHHLHSHGEWFHATQELRNFAALSGLMYRWSQASQAVRAEFLSRIDKPIMDRRYGS